MNEILIDAINKVNSVLETSSRPLSALEIWDMCIWPNWPRDQSSHVLEAAVQVGKVWKIQGHAHSNRKFCQCRITSGKEVTLYLNPPLDMSFLL